LEGVVDKNPNKGGGSCGRTEKKKDQGAKKRELPKICKREGCTIGEKT